MGISELPKGAAGPVYSIGLTSGGDCDEAPVCAGMLVCVGMLVCAEMLVCVGMLVCAEMLVCVGMLVCAGISSPLFIFTDSIEHNG